MLSARLDCLGQQCPFQERSVCIFKVVQQDTHSGEAQANMTTDKAVMGSNMTRANNILSSLQNFRLLQKSEDCAAHQVNRLTLSESVVKSWIDRPSASSGLSVLRIGKGKEIFSVCELLV